MNSRYPAQLVCVLLGILPPAVFPAKAELFSADDEDASTADQLRDVSNDICWTGEWTQERCCKGDPSTTPECWDGTYSFGECCPNADCWEDDIFTYNNCCAASHGPRGNSACWSGVFSYDHCCLANGTAQTWVEVMVGKVDTDQFYTMDDFYTDAQYGDDFGYYSTGHVLKAGTPSPAKLQETQQFAHFTTYPMAMSPHFARVFCRLLFVMWAQLNERTPFRVVEMGAGSGQLAHDVQQCVRSNELGIEPSLWRRWTAAFEYTIMERSPALAQRQRDRGLRVVPGDAQSKESCKPVLRALAQSPACTGLGNRGSRSPECIAQDRGTPEAGASVVLSNELLDAFAPVKLRLSLYGDPDVVDCKMWQEVRLIHSIGVQELAEIGQYMGLSTNYMETLTRDLREYTRAVFCGMANTTVGQEAMARVPENTSCLSLALGLGELVNHMDLGVPAASHHMRLRLRKDVKMWSRLREIVMEREKDLHNSVVLPRDTYRQLRHQLRNVPEVEVHFLGVTQTHQVPVTVTDNRCKELDWWFKAHKERVERLASFYKSLGYGAVHLVVRAGEKNFIDLVDCLLGPSGGYKLSIDYGASFEALGHSLSIDPKNDGIFVPPIPQDLMAGLPECHNEWPKCAGRIDWTTFVDFTNLASAGELLGWRTLFYGPQSLLEHISGHNFTSFGQSYSVPGYSVISKSWLSRHVRSWYGRETLQHEMDTGNWVQRWTSFKVLLLEKPSSLQERNLTSPIVFPSWHLDTRHVDSCWKFDPTTVPLSDWIPRNGDGNAHKAMKLLTNEINTKLGKDYSLAYEEAQLAVRIVDWMVATAGCDSLRPQRLGPILGNKFLWKNMKSRLLRAWGEMWGDDVVSRLAELVLHRIAGMDADEESTPQACAGQQAHKALCENPGGGSAMPWVAAPLSMATS